MTKVRSFHDRLMKFVIFPPWSFVRIHVFGPWLGKKKKFFFLDHLTKFALYFWERLEKLNIFFTHKRLKLMLFKKIFPTWLIDWWNLWMFFSCDRLPNWFCSILQKIIHWKITCLGKKFKDVKSCNGIFHCVGFPYIIHTVLHAISKAEFNVSFLRIFNFLISNPPLLL